MIDTDQVNAILAAIGNVKIAVYGDCCIDAYWMLDSQGSEVSVETGLQAQAVAEHYYRLGGGANIVANLAALQPAQIHVISVIGDDIFGRELRRQLQLLPSDMNLDYLIVQPENFNTVTFGKRYEQQHEQPRIDFGFRNQRSPQTEARLIQGLRHALQHCDLLIFNEQVPGTFSDAFIDAANAVFAEFPHKTVLLDSRHYSDRFTHVTRKCNNIEAAALNGISLQGSDVVSLDQLKQYAQSLSRSSQRPVFITRGPRGILAVDNDDIAEIPGLQLLSKLDTVGAGDTTISALALALAANVNPAQAAAFANYAASVTVQKLYQTGTASPDEVRAAAADPDFIYQPELADDLRLARYHQQSEIERCTSDDTITSGRIHHAVFDHDGTISTLRQGWESVMAPMMIKAILGDSYAHAPETLYHQVRRRVEEYIDQSTGIQTILQMQQLVEMVKQFGIVAPEKILDPLGYKKIYNDALMALVTRRIEKYHRGELSLENVTVKGSVTFLENLAKRGITLYLASGTDRDDVIAEAQALGYAHLFQNRIYGSVGDVTKYSKKMVINQIMQENKLSGPEILVVGDGPVEMRECRKRRGIALGVASDEIRRYGLNPEKRKRLIQAGAQLIVPDFSQTDTITTFLCGS